jgi:copper chaperone CopZ
MSENKTSGKLIGAGLLSAIAASLCCITPVLALIAGSSGIAASFSWIEPARPFLIGLTGVVLGFAWYQKLKPKKADDCCAVTGKPKFMQSKTFLSIVTVFAGLMLSFPAYSQIFFSNNEKQGTVIDKSNVQTAEFIITGMTCTGCEEHVKHAANELEGIVKAEVSYENSNALIQFDITRTNLSAIEKVINSTGYSVTHSELKNQ